jgi:hypothetical protein
MNNINTTIESITPEKAATWLAKNTKNRPIRVNHVAILADDMSNKRWRQDGASYRFDMDGNLLDGQHRLNAIIKSGVTQDGAVIVRGLSAEAFRTMDVNVVSRKPSDVMAINGEISTVQLSAAIRVVAAHKKQGVINSWSFRTVTGQEILDTLESTPGIRSSMSRVLKTIQECERTNGTNRSLIPPGLASGLHYLFQEKDEALADQFLDMALTSTATGNQNFQLFRQRMIGNSLSRSKLDRSFVAALAIKAWNATRTFRVLKTLKVTEEELQSGSAYYIQ